jgi:hypothetical protein
MPGTRGWIGLALLASMAASASPCAAEWRRIDSPNFVIVGDVSARTLRDVAVKFEGFRETLTRVLTERATATPVPTVVIVFPSDRAFTPFKPLYQGKPVGGVAGLFVGRQDANYVAVVAERRDDGFRIVFHEYAHLVVANVNRNVPAWLNEGLAEYYSTFEVSDGGREAILGRPLVYHLQHLNENPLLKLDDLLKVDRKSPLYNERERRSVFYAQSWALTHRILMGEPKRTAQLMSYLQRSAEGVPAAQAWQQAFGAANMERELQEYVRRQAFQATKYTFPEKLAKFDAPVTPLPPADAEAILAHLLLQQGRYDEAAARLTTAAKLDPENARAGTVTALLELARAEHASASKRLLAAGNPSDWLIAYFTAVGIADLVEYRREPASAEDVRAARRLFEIVREQRGDLANALARQAKLELRSATGPTKDTRAAIEKARLMATGREDYAFIHAQIAARLGDFAAARNIAGPLLRNDNIPEVREAARSLMGYIGQLETAAQEESAAAEAQKKAESPVDDAPQPPAEARPLFRDLRPGEERIEGLLERIECSAKGSAVFHVQTADGPAQTAATRMADVEFITYRDDLTGKIGCGPMKPPMSVYLTWRADSAKPAIKLVVAVEFLPKQ